MSMVQPIHNSVINKTPSPIRAAVLGASGIGKYHAKNLAQAGCDVVAILGRSPKSAEQTALKLKNEFGLTVTPYCDIEKLFASESINVVSICTPTELHESFIEKSLQAKAHVFCEKPFLDGLNLYQRASRLFAQAKKNGVHLNVNMQWAIFPELVPIPDSVKTFEVSMEPGYKGEDMLVDQLCHATSVLQKLIPNGKISNISIDVKSKETNKVSFQYGNDHGSCNVRYGFTYKAAQPRAVVFSINGVSYSRKIGENYEQSFVSHNKEYAIKDPFTTSIACFVSSIQGKESALLGEKEILHNLQTQEDILKAYSLSPA